MIKHLLKQVKKLFYFNKQEFKETIKNNRFIKQFDNQLIINKYKESLKTDELFTENINSLISNIETLNFLYIFDIREGNNIFKIHLLTTKEIYKTKELLDVNNYFFLIYQIIKIISFLFNKNRYREINYDIYFYLYDKPRTLFNQDLRDKSIFGLTKSNRFNCTCGYTSTSENKIIITRKNHFSGLLIHELMHLFNLDEKNNSLENDWRKIFYQIVNDKTKPGYFFEGITNFKACLLNIVIKYCFFDEKIKISQLFEVEYLYSYYLCCKIIKFFKAENYKDMTNIFMHNGSMFEYVFIKFLLLSDANIYNKNFKSLNLNSNQIMQSLKTFDINFNNYRKTKKLFDNQQEIIDYYFF